MDRAGWPTRIPAVLFLTIVIAGAGALVAGYGIAVGVGVLIGLVLGAGAGLLGSICSFEVQVDRSTSPATPGIPSARLSRTWPSSTSRCGTLQRVLSGVDLGGTRAVVPVIATVDGDGLAVQLISVEVHDAGAIFNVEARHSPAACRRHLSRKPS